MGLARGDAMSKELSQSITAWWRGLKAHLGVSDEEIASRIEALAWRAGGGAPQPVDRRNVSAWRSRGQFPPQDPRLQAAVVQLMEQMARKVGAPEGVGRWTAPGELHRAWVAARAALEDAPVPRTVEANARKTERLADVLIGSADRSVEEATTAEGMRAGFWQGSWVTDDATPPYVPRTLDNALRTRIQDAAGSRSGGLVVVVGPPKAGKTRCVLEALRATVPHRRLWQLNAVDGALDAAVAAVASDGGRRGPFEADEVVVLLDDLQRHNFHTASGVNDKTLGRAVAAGLLVVATLHQETLDEMRSYARDRTRARSGGELSIGATPNLITMLTDAQMDLLPSLSHEELDGVPDELSQRDGLREVIGARRARLPELLAAVDALEERALQGKANRDRPELAAILLAGIDANYLYPAGATLSELEQLTHWAFQHLFPTRHWDPFMFPPAFEWATTAIGGAGSAHALLVPTSPGALRYGLFDPLVHRLTSGGWDPAHLTPHVDLLDPETCHMVNRRASAMGLADEMRWAERAVDSGNPEAMLVLADLLRRAGNVGLAEAWYLKAADGDDQLSASMSLFDLAELHAERGDLVNAENYLLRAAEINPNLASPLGRIAGYHRNRGDRDAEERWLLRAAWTENTQAKYQVARMYFERHESELGQRWLSRAIATPYGDYCYARSLKYPAATMRKNYLDQAAFMRHPEAMRHLAETLDAEGDHERAADLLERANNPSDPRDLLARGVMHYVRNENDAAKVWLSRSAELEEPEALFLLGTLQPPDQRETWFTRASNLGHAGAMAWLGAILSTRGESDEARSWWLRAAAQHDRYAFHLLALHAEDPAEAEHWWRQGAELFDLDSYLGLARHYWSEGNTDQAEVWFKKASLRGSADAMIALYALYSARGDTTLADPWLTKATHLHDPGAMALRGIVEWDAGNREEAQEWWAKLTLMDGEDAKKAMATVGMALVAADEIDRAELWLMAADQTLSQAMVQLADLAAASGDSEGAERWRERAAAAERPRDDDDEMT